MAVLPAQVTAGELVFQFGGVLVGRADTTVSKLGTLADADQQSLSFLSNPKYRGQLKKTQAAIVLIQASAQADLPTGATAIICEQPYLYYAKVSRLFGPNLPQPSIHSSANIHPTAKIGNLVSIGPNVCIGAGAKLGDQCIVMANVVVGENCSIGQSTQIYPNVTVYHDCIVGNNCIIHSGVVIGADGFGFAPSENGWQKITQVGAVVIGNNVEVGANTCIDRGAIGDTTIGDGCKLDNQIQIAHNVKIGANTVMAACVGVAGSAVIGERCLIGGAAGILGHLSIANDVTISAMSLVTKSIAEPGMYTGVFPLMPNRDWERSAVIVKQLEQLRGRIKALEETTTQQQKQQHSDQQK
jgi:UDP-3-O-[3-hydroxymyristoyl] glucosamine N-acyltransferase